MGMNRILRVTAKFAIGFLVFVIVNVLFIMSSTSSYRYAHIEELPHAQAAVVLGALIMPDGTLSPVLQDRVDMAVRLYKAGIVGNILVTGDNSSLAYNEVNPVRLYLLAQDIPDKDIFLDHAGFNTYSSMYRARDIFLTKKIIVVSQSFHVPRAVYIARALGIEAYGIDADQGYYLMKNYAREVVADLKATFDLIIKTQPKYLGEEIPITGDGRISM